MRQIKFRFWVKRAYKVANHQNIDYVMLYPNEYPDYWYVFDFESQTLMEGDGGKISDFPMFPMQFTGLTDINGKEIYEGDIVKVEYGIGKVIFHQGSFMIEWLDDKEANMELLAAYDDGWTREDINVIGNIHENPEILNEHIN